jgi:hypothetical protein
MLIRKRAQYLKHPRVAGYKAMVAAPLSSIVSCLLGAESRQVAEEVFRFAQTADAELAFSEVGLGYKLSTMPKKSR